MTRFIAPLLVLLLLSAGIYAAHAVGLGEGNRFGRLGAMGKKGSGGGGGTNFRITNVPDFRITNTGDSRIIAP